MQACGQGSDDSCAMGTTKYIARIARAPFVTVPSLEAVEWLQSGEHFRGWSSQKGEPRCEAQSPHVTNTPNLRQASPLNKTNFLLGVRTTRASPTCNALRKVKKRKPANGRSLGDGRGPRGRRKTDSDGAQHWGRTNYKLHFDLNYKRSISSSSCEREEEQL